MTLDLDTPPALPSGAPGTPNGASGDKPPRAKRKQMSGAEKRAKAKGGSSRARTPKDPVAAEIRQIEQGLEALLVGPSVPMRMAGDDWPADHVEAKGPKLAHEIAELARRNPSVRAQLRRLLVAGDGAQLGLAAVSYVAPILIYYGLVPTPPLIKEQLHVPDRGAAREGVVPDWEGSPSVGSDHGASSQARPGPFAEQPPGTAGAPPQTPASSAPVDL